MEMKVVGPGTVTFWWKVSSEYGDYLEFYIDDVRKADIDGTTAWVQSSAYQITGAGTHTLRWQYVKDSSGTENDDCGWVDYVQWSGFTPEQPPGTWQTLRYNYDHDGRRSEKKYDGQTVLTYVYDGDDCIAEYDGSGVLQRKYVYGPGIDQPICMIEGAATSYYHFDALGSVVALSNAAGNTIQVYEYSVWGQVGASDPNHTNPFMFTARRFDKETGLYYYRARYYHPEIGRFLQTDPVGYEAGMNLYRYCSNNPWNRIDPFGLDDCNDSNDYWECMDNWTPDWEGYWECMDNVKRERDRCLDQADWILQEGRAACTWAIKKCWEGCDVLPRWIPLARELCKVNCAYRIGKVCYPAVYAAYVGYAAGCNVYYAASARACWDVYIRPPYAIPKPAI